MRLTIWLGGGGRERRVRAVGEALADYSPSFRAEVACHGADADWNLLALECRDRVELANGYDPVLDYEPQRHQPATRSTWATSARTGAVSLSSGDPLKSIAPRVYVEALTGETVPAGGWMRCPLPDHEDRTPSFQVLVSHWRCFGCGRGGSVIDLAAALYGIEPRGAGFVELRQRIARELLGGIHA